jgi:hypothetical protein
MTSVAVAALGVAAPSASAARLATPEERAAILATDTRPADCLTVTVSTVQEGWALVSEVDSSACATEGRPSIVAFADGAWSVFYSGEDLPDAYCDDLAVPRAVGSDLAACDPAAAPSRPQLGDPQPRRTPQRRNCGNFDGRRWTSRPIAGTGFFDVAARRTDCPTARRLTVRALRTYPGGSRWRVRGWTCRVVDNGEDYATIRCRAAGDRVVAWDYRI